MHPIPLKIVSLNIKQDLHKIELKHLTSDSRDTYFYGIGAVRNRTYQSFSA